MPINTPLERIRAPDLRVTPEEPVGASLGEQVAGAFGITNVVGSAIRDFGDRDFDPFDPTFEVEQHLNPEELPYLSLFADANSVADVDTIRTQLDRSRRATRDRDTGPLHPMVADTIAILADPTTYIPGFGAAGAAAKGGRLATRLVAAGAGAAADAALSEAALQATQRERPLEESMYSVLLGGAFGMGLTGIGAGIGAAMARGTPDMPAPPPGGAVAGDVPTGGVTSTPDVLELQRAAVADAVALDRSTRMDVPDSSLGSAAVPSTADDSLMEYFPGQAMFEKLSKWNVAPVGLRLMGSPLESVRRHAGRLASTSIVTKGNVRGIASTPSVEIAIKRYDALMATTGIALKQMFKGHRKAGGSLGYTVWREEVGRAMRRGDVHADPSVQEAAQWVRTNVFEPLKKQAIEVGLLPPDVSIQEAISYFTRVYNREKIKAQRNPFRTRIVGWLKGTAEQQIKEESERLATKQATKSQGLARADELKAEVETQRQTASDARGRQKAVDFGGDAVALKDQRFVDAERAEDNLRLVDEEIDAIEIKLGRQSEAMRALLDASKRNLKVEGDIKELIEEIEALGEMQAGTRTRKAAYVDTVKEQQRLERSPYAGVDLPEQTVTTRNGTKITHKGPMDLVTWIRSKGGIKDDRGELKARDLKGLTRKGVEFTGRERNYGPLVDNERGMTLEDAAVAAREDGYFPDADQVGPDELLAAIDRTVAAGNVFNNRVWKQQDYELVDELARRREAARPGSDSAAMLDDEAEMLSLDEVSASEDLTRTKSGFDQEIRSIRAEIRTLQRDLRGKRDVEEALGPSAKKFDRLADDVDQLESALVDLEKRRAEMLGRARDLRTAFKQSKKDLSADVAGKFDQYRSFRNAAQKAERATKRAEAELSRLTTRLGALDTRTLKNESRLAELKERAADDLDDIADLIIDKILGQAGGRSDFLIEPLARGPLKERTFHIPDAMIEDWLESDVMEVAQRYIRTMASDVEMTRAFGKANLDDQITEIRHELNEKVRQATSEKEAIRLQDEGNRAIDDLQTLAKVIRGTYGNFNEYAWAKRIGRNIRQYNFLRGMGSAVISSITDLGKISMEEGMLRTFGGIVGDMATGFKGMRMGMKEAKQAGTALDITLATTNRIVADLGDRYAAESKMGRGLTMASNWYAVANLLAPWTQAMKSWSGMLAGSRILDASEKLAKGGKLSRSGILKLARAGIDIHMAKRIAGQSQHWEMLPNSMRNANTGDWTDLRAREAFRSALLTEVDRSVITPSAADVPLHLHTETGKLIFQFKRFAMASTTKLLVSGLQTRDIATLNGIMVMFGLGMLGTALRDFFKNGEIEDRSPSDWIVNSIDRSGVLSIFMEAALMSEKATGWWSRMAGKEPQRLETRDVLGQVLGPSVGLLEDATKAARAFADFSATDQDVDRLARIGPGLNHFALRYWLDQVALAGIKDRLPDRPPKPPKN